MNPFSGKLLLSDLDGTLLNKDGKLTFEDEQAIRRLIDGGGKFTLATGRSFESVRHFLDVIPLNAPVVVSNGAVIYDFMKDCMLEVTALGQKGRELAEALCREHPEVGLEIYTTEGGFVAQMNETTRRHMTRVRIPIVEKTIDNIPGEWYNINITCPPEAMPPIRRLVAERYKEYFSAEHSLPYFYEVTHPQANKGSCALRLCARLGISTGSLYVAGDGDNDVPLLKCTIHSFAPQNASTEAKKTAKYILPSCDSGAIAALIKQMEKDCSAL